MEQRAQKLTLDAIQKLIESLNQGHSDSLRAYLRTMAKHHRYSWFNSILIWIQKPDATFVAGFRKWPELGRHVKKGEKGIMVLAPMVRTRAELRNRDREELEPGAGTQAYGFKPVFVFDVSQTEGQDLPTLGQRSGDPGAYFRRLVTFASLRKFPVEEVDDLAGAHGRCRRGSIQILSSLSPADKFGVLAHEVAHSLLHFEDRVEPKTKTVRETEAEAVAFVVCEAVGIVNGTASQDYIGLYQADSKLLTQSLAAIQSASKQILSSLLH